MLWLLPPHEWQLVVRHNVDECANERHTWQDKLGGHLWIGFHWHSEHHEPEANTMLHTHVSSVARCDVEPVGRLDDNMSPDDLSEDPAGCILHIIIVPSVPFEA